MPFAKKLGKNIGKNVSKNVSSKYGQKRLDHAKQYAADANKTSSKRVIEATGATGNLIGNKTANRIKKISKHS